MKKKILLRGAIGMPTGIAVGYLFTVVLSLIWGKGYYSPCVPTLVDDMGNEIRAVILQTLLCALLGASFAASSVIWEMEHWSIAKQTGTYFLIASVTMLPTAYFLHWMERSLTGFLSYLGIFAGIFLAIWLFQFFLAMRNVQKINAKLK